MPTQLGELANLKELHLLRNRIEELPASLGRLANLEWLDVRSNRLGTLRRNSDSAPTSSSCTAGGTFCERYRRVSESYKS